MTQPREEGSILLLTAFEVAGVGVCFTDEAGNFVRVNPAFCKMLGYRADELVGRPWAMIATPALAANPAAFYAQLLADDSRVKAEWEVRRKDGTHLTTLVSCKSTPRPGGSVLLVSTFTDIQERKAAELEVQRLNRELEGRIAERTAELSQRLHQLEASEAALRASEEQYRQVFDNVSEGIIVVQDGRIALANPRAEHILGHAASELAAQPITLVIHPDDRDMVLDRYRRRMQGLPVEASYYFRVLRPTGEVVWVELSAVMIEWHGQQATLAFITDVTDRKQLEENLTVALDERETILENAVAGIAFLNPKGRLEWANQAISDIFEFDVAKERGTSLERFYPDRDEYLRVGASVTAAVSEGRTYATELQLRRDKGDLFWAQLSGKAVNAKDLSRGTVWTILDITRRKQAEQDIQRALEQQRELNELKTRFVSMTSHEYRTPLATILAAAELLRDYGEKMPKEEVRSILGSIENGVRRMTQMLEDILLIGRADAGRLAYAPAWLSVADVCSDIATESIRAASVELARLEVVCEVSQAKAMLDARLLRHILGNLLSNAFKYSPDGGRVTFRITGVDDMLHFEVRDRGIGIPPEALPRLFETFHRAANVGNIAGTGLGMAIVKRAVDLHGGSISVSSRVGEGSTFEVDLPWRKDAPGG